MWRLGCIALSFAATFAFGASNEVLFLPEEFPPGYGAYGETAMPKAREVELIEARQSPECWPAEMDPGGNWGDPSEGFQLSLRFPKRVYTNGEAIVGKYIMRNVSDADLNYRGRAPKNDMVFDLWDSFGNRIPSSREKRLATNDMFFKMVLASELRYPGVFPVHVRKSRQCADKFHLEYLYTLQPGTYEIAVGWRVPKLFGPGFGWVSSGHAVIEIVGQSNPVAAPSDPSQPTAASLPGAAAAATGRDHFLSTSVSTAPQPAAASSDGTSADSRATGAGSPPVEQLATGAPPPTDPAGSTRSAKKGVLAGLLLLCAAAVLWVFARGLRRRSD